MRVGSMQANLWRGLEQMMHVQRRAIGRKRREGEPSSETGSGETEGMTIEGEEEREREERKGRGHEGWKRGRVVRRKVWRNGV